MVGVNTNAPFGFQQIGRLEGSPYNAAQAVRKIASGYSTKIHAGDPVQSLASGYIGKLAAGTDQIAGIFYGCEYLSTSQKRKVWSPYWPGADATGDVTAYIINDPNATFLAQASAAAIGFDAQMANVQFVAGSGNDATGRSTASVLSGSQATTSTLPFRVIGFQDPALPGGDIASAYNQIIVAFNFQNFKSLDGIHT